MMARTTLVRARSALLGGLVVLAACRREAPSRPPTPHDRDGAACLGSPLRVYDEAPGVLQRVFVDLPIEGQTFPFLLDTGSEQSFLRGSAAPKGGATPTRLSCMDIGLAFSRASVFQRTPDGRTIGGVLGTDLLQVGGVLDLRLRDGLFVWSRDVPPLPAGVITLPLTLTAATAHSKLVVDGVVLDGKKTRLLLDTGSPHVLLVAKEPRASERAFDTFDGAGAPVRLYQSHVEMAFLDGSPRRVPVVRAASFPTLERVLAAIGDPTIEGLLGLGALGHERIVIARNAVHFVP